MGSFRGPGADGVLTRFCLLEGGWREEERGGEGEGCGLAVLAEGLEVWWRVGEGEPDSALIGCRMPGEGERDLRV